jgi:uncharacterized protein (TIGR02001 family)
MKPVSCVASLTLAVALLPIHAHGQTVELSGNVSIVNDYAFRGISQTLQEPAVQGGIDASGPFGLYAGAWGSSVNFGEDLDGGARAQMELDLYAGIAPSVAGFDADLGVLLYAYPGAASDRSYDFLEFYGGLARSLGPVGLGVSASYSPDYFGGSGTALWTVAEASAGIPSTPVSLDGSLGRQQIEENDVWGTPDYTAWSVGASAEVLGASLRVGATGTDLETNECFAGGSELCEPRLILSVGVGM